MVIKRDTSIGKPTPADTSLSKVKRNLVVISNQTKESKANKNTERW